MSRKFPPWFVHRDPAAIRYAFFISHVGEDKKAVRQLKKEIARYSRDQGLSILDCFLDVENWGVANDPLPVIRENLYASDFTVLWVTPAYLENARGWVWIELAYGNLLELSFNYPGHSIDRFPLVVPVFRNVELEDIKRTPLLSYWQRQLFPTGRRVGVKRIAHRLVDFYEQEMNKRRWIA